MAKSKCPQTTGSRSNRSPKKKVGKGKKNGSSNNSRAKYVDLESKARQWAQTHPLTTVIRQCPRLADRHAFLQPVVPPFGAIPTRRHYVAHERNNHEY